MNAGSVPELPVARGLFLCDWLIVDAQTNKVSLINLFDRVRVTQFPSIPKPFVVYALLTDGFGDIEMRVDIESDDGEHLVYSKTLRVRFSDRLAPAHCRFTITSCSFPNAGGYQVVLYANGSPVAQTTVDVRN